MKVLRNTFSTPTKSRIHFCPYTTWCCFHPEVKRWNWGFFLYLLGLVKCVPGRAWIWFYLLSFTEAKPQGEPQVHKFMIFDEAASICPASPLIIVFARLKKSSSSASTDSVHLQSYLQYVCFGQVELLLRHSEVPHVPEYPEDQAEEDQQRSGHHKKVPETQRCEDPSEEEAEADNVKNQSQRQEDDGDSSLLHSQVRRTGGCGLKVWQEWQWVSPDKCLPAFCTSLLNSQHALHFFHSTRLGGLTGIQPQQRVVLLINSSWKPHSPPSFLCRADLFCTSQAIIVTNQPILCNLHDRFMHIYFVISHRWACVYTAISLL